MNREKAGCSCSSLPSSLGRRQEYSEVNARKVFRKNVREVVWERRRRQVRSKSEDLTDEDLDDLKGSIELGFGFKEEQGQKLCTTLPALDFYFAVNRGLTSTGPSLPRHKRSYSASSVSLINANSSSNLNICNSGDDPEQVKTKLRHWAQAVACSVKQTY